jgi:MFS family permease
MVHMASSNTLVQTMTPDELRGRVMAVYTMTFMGMAPLGALLAGALASRIGTPATLAVSGVTCIAAACYFATRWPGLRAQARQLIGADALSPTSPP